MDPEDPEDPDAEARQILTSAEELLVLGKIQKALEQAQIARDYYLESGRSEGPRVLGPEKSWVSFERCIGFDDFW